MKSKAKKVTLLILCLILSLSCIVLYGCNKEDDNNDRSKNIKILSLLTNNFDISIGQTCQIETVFNGEQALVYESTNSVVATVDNNGVVVAKGEGTAFIKITAGNQTEICKITVNKDVYSILINLSKSAIKVDSEIYLTANQYKNGQVTNDNVEWSVDGVAEKGQLISTGNNTVKFLAEQTGDYVITVKTAKASASCSIKVLNENAIRADEPSLQVKSCNLIKWNAVEGATSFDVLINNGDWINTTSTEIDILEFTKSLRNGDSIDIYVRTRTDKNYNFIDSQISKLTFKHDFIEQGETSATCTNAGAMIYKCQNCSVSYVEENYFKPHDFEQGVCSICGNYKTDGVVYLFDDNYIPMPSMEEGFDENSVWRTKYADYYDLTLISENNLTNKSVLNRLLWNQVDSNKHLIPESEREVCYYARSLLDTSLTEVYVAGTYDDGVHGRHDVKYVTNAFGGNKTVKKVVMDENVTELRGAAFQFCSSVETIIMPGITYIPGADRTNYKNNNFNSCYNLKQLVFGDGLVIQGRNFYAQKQIGGNLDAYKCQAEIFILGNGDNPADITKDYDDLLSIFTGNVYYQYEPTDESDIRCGYWYFDEDGEVKIRHHNFENDLCVYDNCHAYDNNKIMYKYDQESDSYFVSSSKFFTKSTLTIPKYYYDGVHGESEKPVTRILSAAFYDNQNIKQVYLPESVTEIGSSAFGLCKNLELVDLGGVELLGRYKDGTAQQNAFLACNNLRYVIIKKNLDVQVQTFIKGSHSDDFGFDLLVKESGGVIEIPEVNNLWTADSKKFMYSESDTCGAWHWNERGNGIVTKLHAEGLHGYCNDCFAKVRAKAAVTYTYDETLDGYVASDIGTFNQAKLYIAEYYNDGVNDKKEVKGIVASLFDGAGGTAVAKNRALILTHVYLPDTITEIRSCAFRLCEKLEFVKMSANISTIESNAFQSCHGLTTMIIQKSLECTTGAFNGGGAYVSANMNIYALEADGTVNITNNGKPLYTGNIYVYSENEASGCWRYVDGMPTLWK